MQKKTLIAFFAILSVSIISYLIIIPLLFKIEQETQEIKLKTEREERLQNIHHHLQHMEVLVENYIVVGSNEFYEAIEKEMETILAELNEFKFNTKLKELKNNYKTKIITLLGMKKTRGNNTNEIIYDLFSISKGIDNLIKKETVNNHLMTQVHVERHNSLLHSIIVLVVTTGLIIFLLSIVISIYFSSKLNKNIKLLINFAKNVADGDLNSKIKISSGDEFEDLSVAFSDMTKQLRDKTVTTDYLNSILSSMMDIVFVVDRSGFIKRINDQVSSVLGYSEKELLGEHLSNVLKDSDRIVSLFQKEFIGLEEQDLITKGGDIIPSQASVSIIQDKKNIKQGYVCVFRDITTLLKAQKEKDIMHQQLIQASKLASLGEMAGGVAHELNNPLAVIQTNLDLIDCYVEEKNIQDDEYKTYTNGINKSIEKMSSIIGHLKTFGRQSGNEVVRVKVGDIITSALSLFGKQFKNRNIEIQKEYEDKNYKIICEPNQIEQVFINLLINARDAMKEKSEKKITISVRQEGDLVYIDFEDTGTGIEQDVIDRIFDPFFTTKEVGKGTGLGLSITDSIIKDHKGEISCRNKAPGEGTIFQIKLPLAKI